MRPPRRRARRLVKWLALFGFLGALFLLAPIAYVEVACRGTLSPQTHQPLITEPAQKRVEANSYLTYPEWHMVYAYDGLAEVLKTGDEHQFDYVQSVIAFWQSTCALMRVADAHGGADWPTRSMIHTIGASFMVEMGAKALYEESAGRVFAWLRGPDKTPQDAAIAAIAADYAAFLRQQPWYRYPFREKARTLWNAPVENALRGWERRLGIGGEFLAKAGYARLMAGLVAATAEAPLTIRSVVTGIDRATLATVTGVTIIANRSEGFENETPRYAAFTRILSDIAQRGGTIVEIAGNDDIMVALTVSEGSTAPLVHGSPILRMKRDGVSGERVLVDLKIAYLAPFLKAYPLGDPGLEHVFDY
jgi:hypothetical protein